MPTRDAARSGDPPGCFHFEVLTQRILAAFDEVRYRGIPVVRMLRETIFRATFLQEFPPIPPRRRLLDSLPGQLFRRLRLRAVRDRLAAFRGRPAMLDPLETRGVLDMVLPRVRSDYALLGGVGVPDRGGRPTLAQLAPGRLFAPPPPLGPAYRAMRQADPELEAVVPEDPAWLEWPVQVAMDLIDASHVFWEETGAPAGFCLTHAALDRVVWGLVGRTLGRRILVAGHGYLYDSQVPVPGAFDLYAAYDAWNARVIRTRSAGRIASVVVGHHGLPPPPAHPPAGWPPASEGPTLLLATNTCGPRWDAYYAAILRRLCAAGVPWTVLWKPHPVEAALPSWGPRCRRLAVPSIYPYLWSADLVLGMFSSVVAEAAYTGRRALTLAHPAEVPIGRWRRAMGVPGLEPGEDVVARVARTLAEPPPCPAVWGPDEGPRAAARLAALIDAFFAGAPLPGDLRSA